MADNSLAIAPPERGLRAKGGWLALLALLSLPAAGVGGLFGTYLVAKVEKAVGERRRLEEEPVARPAAYGVDARLTKLGTIVTNLAGPGNVWIRLESSVVLRKDALPNPDVAVAEIRQDLVAYLRTVSVPQIEGPSGLQHLREDLAERVAMRTDRKVRELFIETLVVQ
ncbi:flagellar basal body-associated FliL family protein [Methylobacterium sp. 1030]|uniref:flagellar basal body-associated FliL family protein n=1 Tax=Methylobacterium sp. 1030 TaxID=3156404 RepID=UPI0033940F21